jgi:Ca2+-binding EF-hand superfamily protein
MCLEATPLASIDLTLMVLVLIHLSGGGGPGYGKLVATGAATWLLGAKYHSGKVAKNLKRKHQSEQKQLYSQYYNDVYKLSEQNQMLQKQVEDLTELVKTTEAAAELEALQRDYDEFKQPDIDGDDRISRAEFNMYVKDYLSSYPGLTEKDYPSFDDFDHDGDGFVNFQEYSQQMALQVQKAELEQMYSSENQEKAQALNDMYNSAKGGAMYY